MKRQSLTVLLALLGFLIIAGTAGACECNNQESDSNEQLMKNQHIGMEIDHQQMIEESKTLPAAAKVRDDQIITEHGTMLREHQTLLETYSARKKAKKLTTDGHLEAVRGHRKSLKVHKALTREHRALVRTEQTGKI